MNTFMYWNSFVHKHKRVEVLLIFHPICMFEPSELFVFTLSFSSLKFNAVLNKICKTACSKGFEVSDFVLSVLKFEDCWLQYYTFLYGVCLKTLHLSYC
jgi:hypothetical protein